MDPVGMTFLALLGVVVAGAWISFSGGTTSPKHAAPKAVPPQVNGWNGKPMAPRPKHWADGGPVPVELRMPRISRRGFGSNLARTPARRRCWSAFVYAGMWSELHR